MREKSGLRLVNVNNVTVINVTATINKEAGINLEACHNISISECALIGNGYDSEYASQGSGVIMKESTDVLIEGCTMTGNTRAGVTVASEFSTTVDCVNITVRDCQISGGSHGIEMSYSNDIHDLTVENCTISNFSHSGFNMHSGIIDPRQTGWVLRNLTFFDDDMTSTMGAMTLNYLTGALLEGIEVTHVNAGHINGIIDIRNSDNTTITECNFHDNVGTMVQTSYGAYDCQNITIKDCIISNCTQYGIWVDSGSVDITISGMMIDGVIGTSGRGIQVDEGEKTSRVSIQDCTITNNQQYGIYVNSYANHVDIRDCDISYNGDGTNDYGIFLSSSTNNVTVVNNTFAGNNGATSTYSSSHIQARDEGDGNRWNDSSGGNRWADWLVPDSNYDGIVDMPYNISGAVGAKDWLPLTDPEDIDPVVIITSPTEGELIDSLNVTIEWQAWDNQTGLEHIEVTVDSDAPVDMGLNTSFSTSLSEGAHSVTVTAFDNAGNSGQGAVAFTITLPTVPGAPAGLVAAPSDRSATLSWAAPDDGGSMITSYHIYRGNDAINLTEVDTTDLLQFTDGGLVNGNTYYYAVSAENAIGEGAMSNVIAVTPANVPGAPSNLSATVNGTSVELSWEEPDDNGSAILHYNVYRGTTGGLIKVGESNSTAYIDAGLNGDTTYRYQVSAVNAIGEGAMSGEVQATVMVPPGPPVDVELTLCEWGVCVEWGAPLSDGGSPVLMYNVYRGLSASVLSMIGNGSALSFNDTEATAGNTYYYAVTAVNAIGEGERSSVENITYITVPGIPEDLTAEVTADGILLSWSAPDSDGGATVTGFCVYYGEGPGPLDSNVSVTSMEHLFEGLQSGTTYYFRVVAINGLGMGGSTEIVNATFVTRPAAPSNVSGEEADGGISLSWSAPSDDGGLDITSYNIYRSVGDGSLVLLTTVDGTSYLDTDVLNDTTYNYVIKAVNGNGEGVASSEYSITFNPSEPDDGDDGIPWYLIAIPLIVVVLLLLLFLLDKRNKDKKRKKEDDK